MGKTTLIKALLFGGKEKTYQSWYGIDADKMAEDRTYNYAGMYTDAFGNTRFYDNQTDNYQQDHFQLHWNEKVSDTWNTNLAIHYTKGKGFYEEYQNGQNFADYNLTPVDINGTSINTTDLVRQKWLDNDFYGATFSANYKKDKLDIILGGAWNKYEGKHFGTVIWARFASTSELGDHYYDYFGNKTDGNFFAKANYQITKRLALFGDLQFRTVNYSANGVAAGWVNDTYNFFNPKAGLNFTINNKNTLYFSYAKANREPNRTDYEGGKVKPEKLDDFELGWRYTSSKTAITANFYYMYYRDQLILTGNLDNVGNPIRSNSEKSYRLGLEVEASFKVSEQVLIRPNFTLSQNKNLDLNVLGNNVGTKDISYSPAFIAANGIFYSPMKSFQIGWLSKYVGSQYLNNIESTEAKLADYFVNDLNIAYEIKPKSVFQSIVITGMVNNIFNKLYISNGYMYDITPYYYPQAGIHFLSGITLKF